MAGTFTFKSLRDYWLVLLSCIFLAAAIVELSTFWIPPSSLATVKGTLLSASSDVTSEAMPGFRRWDPPGKRAYASQKIVLAFTLKEYETTFILEKSIGTKPNDETYSRILDGLRQADSITVWIRRDEVNSPTTVALSIDTNKEPGLLEISTIRWQRTPLLAGLFLASTFSFLFFLLLRSVKAQKLRRPPPTP
jgi:hypothetical protein